MSNTPSTFARSTPTPPGPLPDHLTLDGGLFGQEQACFGCGPNHPSGFRLGFTREGDEIVTRFTPDGSRQGPPGVMHGGLVATVADELAAWTIVAQMGKFGFTASFAAKYRGPLRIGREVEGRGRIVKDARRIVDVEVKMTQGGALAFTGDFRFVLLDKSGAERMIDAPMPVEWERFCR